MSNTIKDQVLEEYSALAVDYDEKWSTYTKRTLALSMAALQLKPITENQSLLDVGCGTGEFLQMVAEQAPTLELYGVEPNSQMLAVAKHKFAAAAHFKEAWAHDLPYEDAFFDYVVSNNMFHYIEEPMHALEEFKRVLRPDGQLIVMDWCGDFWTMRLNAWYLDIRKKVHVATYTSKQLETMLWQVGFEEIVVEQKKTDKFWGIMVAKAILRN